MDRLLDWTSWTNCFRLVLNVGRSSSMQASRSSRRLFWISCACRRVECTVDEIIPETMKDSFRSYPSETNDGNTYRVRPRSWRSNSCLMRQSHWHWQRHGADYERIEYSGAVNTKRGTAAGTDRAEFGCLRLGLDQANAIQTDALRWPASESDDHTWLVEQHRMPENRRDKLREARSLWIDHAWVLNVAREL